MRRVFLIIFLLLISNSFAEHILSDGMGGFYTNEGHYMSDGVGGLYILNGGHIMSDGVGGAYK